MSTLAFRHQASAFSKSKEQRFRRLEVWNKAMTFVEKMYKVSSKFPDKELYGLTSQIRRAAVSIALNIAEGSGSNSDAEFKRFLNIALRSSYEVMCGLEIACRLDYCSKKDSEELLINCDELSAMITGLRNKLKSFS